MQELFNGPPVLIPDNPLWPLPPDYFELDPEARRAARINGCRQYLHPSLSTEQAANYFARCNDFFDRYYLKPDPKGILRWDPDADLTLWADHIPNHPGAPIFYKGDAVRTPAYHYELDYQYWLNRSFMVVCPRGAGKTKKIGKRILLRMLAEPNHEVIYATSTHSNAEDMGEMLSAQFRSNERILSDFGIEGRLVPRKGEGRFNMRAMRILNGSVAKLSSVGSIQRGQRPNAYELDDPEADARTSTDMASRRKELERGIFNVIEPMLTAGHARLAWTGTFVSRQHLLWFAMQTEKREDGSEVAEDSRFDYWSRMVVRLVYEDEDGKLQSVWPEMFPVDAAERDRLPAAKGRLTIEERRARLGPAFRSEYMADPGGSEERYFPFDRHAPDAREQYGWWLEEVDGKEPTRSNALICWNRWHSDDAYTTQKVRIRELLAQSPPFILLDTSYTSGPSSDFKVAHVFVMTPHGDSVPELLSLDMWYARCDESVLVRKSFELATKWGARRICPEYLPKQRGLYDVLMRTVKDRLYTRWGAAQAPAIHKFMAGFQSKVSKIASLSLWFEHRLIKLPWAHRSESAYQHLMSQIEQFNPESDNGGLQNDDHIDTVAMAACVSRISKETIERLEAEQEGVDPIVALKEGRVTDPETGLHYGAMIDYSKISVADLMEIGESVRKGSGTFKF